MIKLLKEDYVYQHMIMSRNVEWNLRHHTGIKQHLTSVKTSDGSRTADFMLLANSEESVFLEGCGLDLSEVYCDYFIVELEKL